MKLLIIGTGVIDEAELPQLERQDFEVIYAPTLKEGLTYLDERPAIVVLDLASVERAEVLVKARELDLDCQMIIVLEGRPSEVAGTSGLEILRRPLDYEELIKALARARERKDRSDDPAALLVIEDHEPTLARLVRILRKEGYRVEGAADGLKGLDLLGSQGFDLVLCDVRLPGKSGLEVLRETKARAADVEFIMTTGFGGEELVVAALEEGAVSITRKPVDLDHLLMAVERALEGQKMCRTLARRDREIAALSELILDDERAQDT